MTDEEIKAMKEDLKNKIEIIDSLRKENAKTRNNNKSAEEKLAELEAEKERLQREKEQAELEAKGKYEEASAKLREGLTAEKQKEAERAARFEKMFKAEKIDRALITAASDTVSPETAAMLAKKRFQFDVDEKGEVIIKQGDTIATTDDGKPMDFTAVIGKIKESDPYLVPSNGGGSGSTGGAGGGIDSDAKAMNELAELAGLK